MDAEARSKALSGVGQIAIALITLAVLGWLLVFIVTAIVRALGSVESQVATAIIAGSVTISLSVTGVVISKWYERRAAVERESRAKRIPVYEDFVGFLFRIFFQNKPHVKKMSDSEMTKALADSTQKLAVWSSDEVLRLFGQFRTLAISHTYGTGLPEGPMFALEDVIFAIRKDLGYKNSGLKRGDLLRLFINDIDEHLVRPAASAAGASGNQTGDGGLTTG